MVNRAIRRGEIWTASGGKDYAGKPRPVLIIQSDGFDGTSSVTICGLTTNATDAPLLRIAIEPSDSNGLREASSVMVDKVTTIPKTKIGDHLGQLAEAEMARINRSLAVFLGLAGNSTN
jgi:mRNA interferase MazF